MNETLERLRALIASGAIVLTLGSGWYLVGPPDDGGPTLRVAAFNIQVFGDSKAGKPAVMDVLARTAREFDVLVVEEIRDADEQVADLFLDAINADAAVPYAMVESERLGRTSAKEQYAIYYRTGLVEVLGTTIPPDSADVFEREPLVASLTAGGFTFKLVAIHVRPDDAEGELEAPEGVVTGILADDPDEPDVIVLGDLNADCTYLDEEAEDLPLRGQGFEWVIANDIATSTRTDCTYDRIILTEETFVGAYVPGSAGVFRFDEEFGLSDHDFVISVSDHYPVEARFRIAESQPVP